MSDYEELPEDHAESPQKNKTPIKKMTVDSNLPNGRPSHVFGYMNRDKGGSKTSAPLAILNTTVEAHTNAKAHAQAMGLQYHAPKKPSHPNDFSPDHHKFGAEHRKLVEDKKMMANPNRLEEFEKQIKKGLKKHHHTHAVVDDDGGGDDGVQDTKVEDPDEKGKLAIECLLFLKGKRIGESVRGAKRRRNPTLPYTTPLLLTPRLVLACRR